MKITRFHPRADDFIGFIPDFLSEADPRPAAEQFNERYAHGGGWRPFKGFILDTDTMNIQYPEDPPYAPVARIDLRDEQIYIYPHAWVMIYRNPTDFEIARMD